MFSFAKTECSTLYVHFVLFFIHILCLNFKKKLIDDCNFLILKPSIKIEGVVQQPKFGDPATITL